MKKFLLSPSILSLLSGMLAVLAFAPFHFYPLMLVSMTALLWVWQRSTPREAFGRGFCYGLGFFGIGVSWVYVSLHTFGDAPMIFAGLLTAFFIAILALFPALVGLSLNRFYPSNTSVKLWLVFPAIWTLAEWVRSWVFTGFPWLLAGSSQSYWPLSSIIPLAGTYMASFVLAHLAGGIIYYHYASSDNRRNILAYFAVLLLTCHLLYAHPYTHASGTPFNVSLVQGNITPSVKWQPGETQNNFQHYLKLTAGHWDHRLVIWPEAAIATPLPHANAAIRQLKQLSQQYHAGIITGVPYESTNIIDDYNAAIAIGDAHGLYFKRHLVPFGEYFPMQAISQPLLHWLKIPMSNFKAGPDIQDAMTYNGIHFATFLCYEIIFAEEVRNTIKNAGVILTLSDDAWFGHSMAQAQHLQIAQIRAMETGRFVLSVTNNGITAIINPQGKIIQQLLPFQPGVLSAKISSFSGETPWLKFGSNIFLLICILSLIIGKINEKHFINFKPQQ